MCFLRKVGKEEVTSSILVNSSRKQSIAFRDTSEGDFVFEKYPQCDENAQNHAIGIAATQVSCTKAFNQLIYIYVQH